MNIFGYLDWRADVPFSAVPFNDVDNLILSELAYTDFGGIVPETGESIPLSGAHDLFFASHSAEELRASSSFLAKSPLLMEGMLSGARFADTRLCRYINEVDADRSAQISAVTFLLDDGSAYVAFRGTDNSLTGWKEDFNLGYLSETAGQKRAVEYLNQTASLVSRPLRVGGHSKGGNFAVYATACCNVRDRILSVYSNDGPGFREEVLLTEGYRAILPKVIHIIPDTSVIGLLLSSAAERRVVKSSAAGIMQHDGFSWETDRSGFVEAELSELGKLIDRTLDTWIAGMDDETRMSLTETLFTAFESTGKSTFHEIGSQKLKSTEAILSTMVALPKEKQSEFIRLAGQLVQSGGQAALSKLPEMIHGRKSAEPAPSGEGAAGQEA
ncbi:MAG: DUF2974 domain-containing protein [Oscillospiraceae bacterium]|nr:DUF2974 domain-containing protein [Oscillospiraceae bacterium]